MRSIFINPDERVAVSDNDGNTIFIRSRIDFQTYAKIEEGLMKLEFQTRQNRNGKTADDDVTIGARFTANGQRLALLSECILAWDGPIFKNVPCTKANIRMLDPRDPLVEKVLNEIEKRNEPPTVAPPPQSASENDDPNG